MVAGRHGGGCKLSIGKHNREKYFRRFGYLEPNC